MQLEHYHARTTRVNRRRFYEIAGHRYPGVTTILSATKPPEARAALNQWRRRVGAQAAQEIAGKASSVGTRLHKQIAAFLKGDMVDIPADITGYWDSIEPLLANVDEALLVEAAVWHNAGYVGFPDALVVYNSKVYVCDWKTALKPKKAEWIGDYYLQVAAYTQAIEQVYAEQGIHVEGTLIAIALEQTPAQAFWLNRAEIEHHWTLFQRRLAEYHMLHPKLL
ncbi:MAG: hypothetical protein F6J95_003925 [Leptolyngbya sp. SIO1E4]|nr:hypothetical protein [Leptolyngbya sp. SIO1E4]